MSSKKVTDLPVVGVASVDDLIMVVQGGTSKQQAIDDIVRSAGFIGGFHIGAEKTLPMLAASGYYEFPSDHIDGSFGLGNIAAAHSPAPARLDFNNRDSAALLVSQWSGKFSVDAVLEFEIGDGTDGFGGLKSSVKAGDYYTLTAMCWFLPGSTNKAPGLRVKTDTDGTLTTTLVLLQGFGI